MEAVENDSLKAADHAAELYTAWKQDALAGSPRLRARRGRPSRPPRRARRLRAARPRGAHLVRKPVAWPGQGKLSDRTGNCVTKVPGYVVYSVVSSTHYQTNVPLCSGSHKITCLHALCDSIGTALVLRPRRIAHMAPLHRKHFHRNHGSLTTISAR